MARFKYLDHLQASTDAEFDRLFAPGETAPTSGIYRCDHCGAECTQLSHRELPARNHHQHEDRFMPIQWRLIVAHRGRMSSP